MKDTEAGDVRRHGSMASFNGSASNAAPRVTRRSRSHKSAAEDSDRGSTRWNDVPVDFDEVQTRLQAGKYDSIVCTVLPMLDLLAVMSMHLVSPSACWQPMTYMKTIWSSIVASLKFCCVSISSCGLVSVYAWQESRCIVYGRH